MAGRLPRLSDAAWQCLLGMAFTAHDTGTDRLPQACYFGGWEYLALGWLRYEKFDRAAHDRTARALAELGRAGLIESLGWRGSSRGPRIYRLHLDPLPPPPTT